MPDASLGGLLTLSKVLRVPAYAPEACGVSTVLVRCLTDVVDVLCGHPDGLLLDEASWHAKTGSRRAPCVGCGTS